MSARAKQESKPRSQRHSNAAGDRCGKADSSRYGRLLALGSIIGNREVAAALAHPAASSARVRSPRIQRACRRCEDRACILDGAIHRLPDARPAHPTTIRIGPTDDTFEREAVQVAKWIVPVRGRTELSGAAAGASEASCHGCGGNEREHARLSAGTLTAGGVPLPATTRAFFEDRLGHDFGRVRVHQGDEAERVAYELDAAAFTLGHHVWLGHGHTLAPSQTLAHELVHVIQQTRTPTQSGASPSWIQRQPHPGATPTCTEDGGCRPRCPENCHTYEQWIATFSGLDAFPAYDGAGSAASRRQRVLGDADGGVRSPETPHPEPPQGGDQVERLIDRPRRAWLERNLSPELIERVYDMGANCADVALILYGVWLEAHGRSVEVARLQCGYVPAEDAATARQRHRGMLGRFRSANGEELVNAYTDVGGNPIREWRVLRELFHPGDIIVIEHLRRAGRTPFEPRRGHVMTVESVRRNGDGEVESIWFLQGNQPLGSDDVRPIENEIPSFPPRMRRSLSSRDANRRPLRRRIREAPGRRIERIDEPAFRDGPNGAYRETRRYYDVIVAAGPPVTARGRSVRAAHGRRPQVLGAPLDWVAVLDRFAPPAVDEPEVRHAVEASLRALRAAVEGAELIDHGGDRVMPDVGFAEATALGVAIGEACARVGLSTSDMQALIRAYGGPGRRRSRHRQGDALFVRSMQVENAALRARRRIADARAWEQARTAEEARLGRAPVRVDAWARRAIRRLQRALRSADLDTVRTQVLDVGASLWRRHRTRAQARGTDLDDRSLYWQRLEMTQTLRTAPASSALSLPERQRLVDLFERASRGMVDVGFSSEDTVRVLISGFDPFMLDANPAMHNASGSVVLALDGETIADARVEGVIFPVRFMDFDAGAVERFFGRFMRGAQRVHMIVTLSHGPGRDIEIEQWAAPFRSSLGRDNVDHWGGGSPMHPRVISVGEDRPRFLGTTLPAAVMERETQGGPIGVRHDTSVPSRVSPHQRLSHSTAPGLGEAVSGSGGGYLSNEIFYRVRALQEALRRRGGPELAGHVHVPAARDAAGRRAIVATVRSLIEAALRAEP